MEANIVEMAFWIVSPIAFVCVLGYIYQQFLRELAEEEN